MITAQPQIKIITPQGRMQMQQIQTPSGPKLIAVPVNPGQAAAAAAAAAVAVGQPAPTAVVQQPNPSPNVVQVSVLIHRAKLAWVPWVQLYP